MENKSEEKICDKYAMQIKIVLWAVAGVIILPIIVIILLKLFGFAESEIGDWITFYGTLFGGIIGASVIFFVAKYEIDETFERQKETDRMSRNEIFRKNYEKEFGEKVLKSIDELERFIDNIEAELIIWEDIAEKNNKELFIVALDKYEKAYEERFEKYVIKFYELYDTLNFNGFILKIFGIHRLFEDFMAELSKYRNEATEINNRMKKGLKIKFEYGLTQHEIDELRVNIKYKLSEIKNDKNTELKKKRSEYEEMRAHIRRQIQLKIFEDIYPGKEYDNLKKIEGFYLEGLKRKESYLD